MRNPALVTGLGSFALCTSLATGQELTLRHTMDSRLQQITALAVSGDGTTIATVGGERDAKGSWWSEFRVWDVESGKKTASFIQNTARDVESMALSPAGKRLAVLANGKLTVWSIPDGSERGSCAVPFFYRGTVAFADDGKQLGAATQEVICICDGASAANPKTVKRSSLRRYSRLAFRPDLEVLASPDYQDVDLFDTATGKSRAVLEDHPGTVSGFAFSQDGARLAVIVSKHDDEHGFHADTIVWDLAKNTKIAQIQGLGYTVGVALVGGQKLAVLTTRDLGSDVYELQVADIATGKVLSRYPFPRSNRPRFFAASADGRTLTVAGDDGKVHVFQVRQRGD
jgi:WD40 repeat protein